MKILHRLMVLIILAILFLPTGQVHGQSSVYLDIFATYEFGEQITFTAQTKSTLQILNASIVIYDPKASPSFVLIQDKIPCVRSRRYVGSINSRFRTGVRR